jgi:hypothetical protein
MLASNKLQPNNINNKTQMMQQTLASNSPCEQAGNRWRNNCKAMMCFFFPFGSCPKCSNNRFICSTVRKICLVIRPQMNSWTWQDQVAVARPSNKQQRASNKQQRRARYSNAPLAPQTHHNKENPGTPTKLARYCGSLSRPDKLRRGTGHCRCHDGFVVHL